MKRCECAAVIGLALSRSLIMSVEAQLEQQPLADGGIARPQLVLSSVLCRAAPSACYCHIINHTITTSHTPERSKPEGVYCSEIPFYDGSLL